MKGTANRKCPKLRRTNKKHALRHSDFSGGNVITHIGACLGNICNNYTSNSIAICISTEKSYGLPIEKKKEARDR